MITTRLVYRADRYELWIGRSFGDSGGGRWISLGTVVVLAKSVCGVFSALPLADEYDPVQPQLRHG